MAPLRSDQLEEQTVRSRTGKEIEPFPPSQRLGEFL
jgi:hypothetical protein